eukprot:Nitzschia sp. Nitz4//scaffold23_size168460//165200//166537//NITZ4_002251-RA/size168460-processed-gene-0.277-mRNA-1//-1//CDS//3329543731//4921//frame0
MSSTGIVSIRLRKSLAEEAEYDAIFDVKATILVDSTKVGHISAIIVDRSRIPEHLFYSVFDAHSADLQWIGCTLMEPRLGRTYLESLQNDDDPRCGFMYISKLTISNNVQDKQEVATKALNKLFRHQTISGSTGGKVTTFAYVLDTREQWPEDVAKEWDTYKDNDRARMFHNLSAQENARRKELIRQWEVRLDEYARMDAIPFLRNGFFEDTAVSEATNRILVSSSRRVAAQILSLSHARVMRLSPLKKSPDPQGINAELFEYMIEHCTDKGDMGPIRAKIQSFVRDGVNIMESDIIHEACESQNFEIVKLILELEPNVVNEKSGRGFTPLMVAAVNTRDHNLKLIDLLLAAGADKSVRNERGSTACGLVIAKGRELNEAMQAIMGHRTGTEPMDPHLERLRSKIMPTGGLTPTDLAGGSTPGLIVYPDEDSKTNFDDDDDIYDY